MSRLFAALSVPALLAAAPALAAEAAPATAPATVSEVPADPARLAAARQTVDYVFPAGTYARIMNGTMDKIMDSIMDSMLKMPLKDLAGIGGVDTSKLSSASMAEIMEIYDPSYKERTSIITHTMMSQMAGIMTEFEPDIRDGLAQAYAEKFDVKQLGELNAFFATPTGKEYAADSYLIMMSPQVMAKMQAFMPKMMKQMPAIMEKVKTATADLPKPRKFADLSKAEKTKLAKILGLSETELEKQEAARGQ
ncbi:DUF2059 domain-containing protein [Novosphingobium beihaiensis]|uniref:DUF2059 domain-containing protein n=1 Tax=Novosphingobium beihaiensis TaxID=2930389 RepID=A0ABT0BRV0_9SPHN|nr:DUF2059 domain-containing protein [Novosphingobium beihaiensis]MCJ2187787.1 DUF2059 domain-containing protein [Novosphingobium beihaiensis]